MALPNNTANNPALNNSDIIFRYFCTTPFSSETKTRIYYYTPAFKYSSYVVGSFNVAAAIPTVLANMCLLIAVLRTNTLRSVQNIILVNVVFVNILQGLVAMPFHGAILIFRGHENFSCNLDLVLSIIGIALALTSMLTVDLLTYERCVAILYPFSYESKFTSKSVMITCAAFWVFSLAVSVCANIKAFLALCLVIATVVTVGTYIFNVIVHVMIFRTVVSLRGNQARLRPMNRDLTPEQQAEKRKQERRTVKFTAYVICFLLATYLPSTVKNIMIGFFSMPIFQPVADTVLLFHATLSPFLYIWQSPQMGRAVKRLLHCKTSVQIDVDPVQVLPVQ